MALNLGNEAAQGEDIVNGAKNISDQVSLQVIETDAEHSAGWSSAMLAAMKSLKEGRHLCSVISSMAAYEKMLLTEITATQDEENQEGWSGELIFLEYLPAAGGNDGEGKTNTNSSVRTNTGTTGNLKKVTGTALTQLLQRAGV